MSVYVTDSLDIFEKKINKMFDRSTSYFEKHNSFLDDNYYFVEHDKLELPIDNLDDKQILKIINKKTIESILLKMEMKTLYIPKMMNKEEIFKHTFNTIKRYQWKAGGFFIDSMRWKNLEYSDKDDDLAKNNIFRLTNTINNFDVSSDETGEYVEVLITKLNSLSSNYVFKMKKFEMSNNPYVNLVLVISRV